MNIRIVHVFCGLAGSKFAQTSTHNPTQSGRRLDMEKEKPMKATSVAILLLSMLVAGMAAAQTSTSRTTETAGSLYDNFNQNFIDPSKWSAIWQCGSPAMECVREIENGQLRLRVRAYGATDANDGTQFATSAVNLTAASVKDISAQVIVRNSNPKDCAANAGVAHSQALVFGAFFNGGGGTAADDVVAYLQLDRSVASGPGTVEVGGFLFYQGQFFANVDLGPINIGEKVIVGLQWDQPNHRFVAHLARPTYGTNVEQSMPYSISDTNPAVAPFKSLSANVFPPNCAGTAIPADLDVSFDNVRVSE